MIGVVLAELYDLFDERARCETVLPRCHEKNSLDPTHDQVGRRDLKLRVQIDVVADAAKDHTRPQLAGELDSETRVARYFNVLNTRRVCHEHFPALVLGKHFFLGRVVADCHNEPVK